MVSKPKPKIIEGLSNNKPKPKPSGNPWPSGGIDMSDWKPGQIGHDMDPFKYQNPSAGWNSFTASNNPQPGGKSPAQAAAEAAQAAANQVAEQAAAEAAAAKASARADAQAVLQGMLEQWGLGSLTGTVIGLLQQDMGVNQIVLELRKSDAYKQRFVGNEERIKQGYAALDPAEYLAVEDTYQRIMQQAGMPKGFYDEPSDFGSWIGANVSPAEIQERIDTGLDAVNNSDPNYLQALRRAGFTDGDMLASMLDQNRALPLLRRAVGTAKIGTAAMDAGLNYDDQRATQFYDQLKDANGGVDQQFARSAYSAVAGALPGATKLSTIYGEQVDQGTLEDEFLGRNELASQKRKRLAQRELVEYQGSGGTGENSFQNKGRGEF